MGRFRHGLVRATFALLGACGQPPPEATARDETPPPPPAPAPAPASPEAEAAHRVVFADRTSHAYLLLLPVQEAPPVPTRESLALAVRRAFKAAPDHEEVQLLLALIERTLPEPKAAPARPDDPGTVDQTSDPLTDLLGLRVEVLAIDDDVISAEARTDEVLLRALTRAEHDSLAQRRFALLLRAEYRNQHAVRGLRLLQALVRVLAEQQGALIHDPDTLETIGPVAFERRRLQSSLGNVADQIAVVPFPDPRHAGRVRLTTRGMRRFGAVDLELDGLSTDPWLLQRATDLLVGLALVLVREGEYDASGFAVELDPVVGVHWRDIAQAYSGRGATPPRCADCPQEARVHLVERPREPQDPHGHVVARVVAPRAESDRPDYDQPAFAARLLRAVFGDAPAR